MFYKTLKEVCLVNLNNSELCSVNLWKLVRSVILGNLFNLMEFSLLICKMCTRVSEGCFEE